MTAGRPASGMTLRLRRPPVRDGGSPGRPTGANFRSAREGRPPFTFTDLPGAFDQTLPFFLWGAAPRAACFRIKAARRIIDESAASLSRRHNDNNKSLQRRSDVPDTQAIQTHWKTTLVILTLSAVLMSLSYTMLIPFLPMYLIEELGVDQSRANFWSGLVFSVSFLISGVMAPIWGAMADKRSRKLMRFARPSCSPSPMRSAASCRTSGSFWPCGAFRASPPDYGLPVSRSWPAPCPATASDSPWASCRAE